MMADPRPLRILGLVQLMGVAALVLWWGSLTPSERWSRLYTIAQEEAAVLAPPPTIIAQGAWLWTHRLARLQGVAGLALLSLGIGLAEGIVRRHRDPLGGFRLAWWTSGLVVSLLSPGLCAGAVLAPWPVPLSVLASLSVGSGGVIGWMLAAGRPQIT